MRPPRWPGSHRAGQLGDEIERLFPFDPAASDPGSRIPYDRTALAAQLERVRTFVTAGATAFSGNIELERFIAEVPEVLALEEAIRCELNQAKDLIALCHWNLNLDKRLVRTPSGWIAGGRVARLGLRRADEHRPELFRDHLRCRARFPCPGNEAT